MRGPSQMFWVGVFGTACLVALSSSAAAPIADGRSAAHAEKATVEQAHLSNHQRLINEARAMAGDTSSALRVAPLESPDFSKFLALQIHLRNLSEAAIFKLRPDNGIKALALGGAGVARPRQGMLENTITPATVASLRAGNETVEVSSEDRYGAVVRLPSSSDTFLYVSRSSR